MGDWVDREHVLAAFNTGINNLDVDGKANANRVERYLNRVLDKIKSLPSAEEESFEWCTDCKEYDQEKHCCPRWTKVIRNMVEEIRGTTAVGEWVIVHGLYTPGGDPVWKCSNCGKGVHVYGVEHGSYGADMADHQWVACPNCGAVMIGERYE